MKFFMNKIDLFLSFLRCLEVMDTARAAASGIPDLFLVS
jgi:hypothetical protein